MNREKISVNKISTKSCCLSLYNIASQSNKVMSMVYECMYFVINEMFLIQFPYLISLYLIVTTHHYSLAIAVSAPLSILSKLLQTRSPSSLCLARLTPDIWSVGVSHRATGPSQGAVSWTIMHVMFQSSNSYYHST